MKYHDAFLLFLKKQKNLRASSAVALYGLKSALHIFVTLINDAHNEGARALEISVGYH